MSLSFAVTEIAAGLVGPCLGSFAVTAALRAARGEPFLAGRSHCDACGLALGYLETVPVASFVSRRGVCGACGARIEPLHLIGELGGAAILMTAFAIAEPVRATLLSALALALLASAVIDLKTMRLPNALSATVAALGLILAAMRPTSALLQGLGAGLATLLVLEAIRRGYLSLRKTPGLGLGDVKLAAALALWLGLATPLAIGCGAVIGIATALASGRKAGRFPFGPALAAGALIVGLTEEALRWPTSA